MRWRFAVPAVMLSACAWFQEPLEVHGVDPTLLQPGDLFRVDGEGFGAVAEAALVREGESHVLPVARMDGGWLKGVVPDEAASGLWRLEVRRGKQTAQAASTLEVWRADTEPPCNKRYALHVESSALQGEIKLIRRFAERDGSIHLWRRGEVAAIRTTRHAAGPDGADTCHAVWVVDADGRDWLVADDEVPQHRVAQHLADAVGAPVEAAP